jgi:hypothetical protein
MHACDEAATGDQGLQERESTLQLDKLAIAKRAQRVSFHVTHSVTRGLNFEPSDKEFDIFMSF